MNQHMKYITVLAGFADTPTPIIFGDNLNHADVAENFGGPAKVLGAGFIIWSTKGMRVYGSSTSLGIGVDKGDQALINKWLQVDE